MPVTLRVNILGVGISAVNMSMALDTIKEWISQGDPNYVCVTPVHGIMECRKDPALRRELYLLEGIEPAGVTSA